MEAISFSEVEAPEALAAPQAPGTNALVHNPFAFEDVEAPEALAAPQAPGTNALVHNPFAWAESK
ncbi:streptamidine-related RiPP repeat protein [Amycolatopsis anabasis]|uniref:streptamidine-related RiPP repeat protein n=1 Tax=Amycolatopsis anabasis TaxID=1840409 RepID=UPI00131C302F|nr:streptamidine-related RiPP repeat protein [Amycolatopsis anabasis]